MAVTGWIGDDERVEMGSRWMLPWLARVLARRHWSWLGSPSAAPVPRCGPRLMKGGP